MVFDGDIALDLANINGIDIAEIARIAVNTNF